MAFPQKNWQDEPSEATPINAAALKDMEARLGAYVDDNAAPVDGSASTPSLRTLGTGSHQATAGNDARLSDNRTPSDGSVVNAKVPDGALSLAKLVTNPLARANHTGTQLAVTISDFASAVSAVVGASEGVSVKSYGAVGDGVADDTTAVNAAVSASNGGEVFFPDGTYNVAIATQSILATNGNRLVGESRENTIIQFVGNVTDGTKNGICIASGRLELENLTIKAPTQTGSSGTITWSGIFHSGSTGTVVLKNCHTVAHSYAIRTFSAGTHRVMLRDSTIEGAGVNAGGTPGSMGVHMPGGQGAELLVFNCDFLKTGDSANHFGCHSIYIYESVAYHVEDCRFDHTLGRYMQSFGDNYSGNPAYAEIVNCEFGADIPNDVQGVMTNHRIETKVIGGRSLHPGQSFQVQGDATFANFEFASVSGDGFYAPVTYGDVASRATYVDCVWSCTNAYGMKTGAMPNLRLLFQGCRFIGTADYWLRFEAGSAGSTALFDDCLFDNLANASGDACIRVSDAVTIVLQITRFTGNVPKNAIYVDTAGNASVLHAGGNDFSQVGATLTGPGTIATQVNWGNYGSVGLADSAVITDASVAAGAAIALSKLATNPLARANHTGTQTASTISDFDTQVRTSRLDQLAVPTASVAMNAHGITGLADPGSAQDAATKAYVDARRLDQLAAPTAAVAMNAQKITGMADPTSAQDGATKAYVDAHAGGSKTFRTMHTFAIQGAVTAITVPGFYAAVAAGQTTVLAKCVAVIGSGTTVNFRLQKNGSDITGFGTSGSPLGASTTKGVTDPTNVAIADEDLITLLISSVSGAPTDLVVTLTLEHTV